MRNPTVRFRTIVLLPVFAIAAAAQAPPSNWDTVKALAPGTQVRVAAGVTPGATKALVGTLENITDSDITLMQGATPRSVPRAQVAIVSVKKQRRRLHNTLIGLAVGTAAGIVIGAAAGVAQAHACKGLLCGFALPVDAAGAGAVGLVVGTLAGAFWPPGWRRVYVP